MSGTIVSFPHKARALAHELDRNDPNVTKPTIEEIEGSDGTIVADTFCQWCYDYADGDYHSRHLRECRERRIDWLRDKLLHIIVRLDDMPTRLVVDIHHALDALVGFEGHIPDFDTAVAHQQERDRAVDVVLEHAANHPECYPPFEPTGKVAS